MEPTSGEVNICRIRSYPQIFTSPEVGSIRATKIRIKVDLPAPFGPKSPNIPVGISRQTSFNAWFPFGYTLLSFLIDMLINK